MYAYQKIKSNGVEKDPDICHWIIIEKNGHITIKSGIPIYFRIDIEHIHSGVSGVVNIICYSII